MKVKSLNEFSARQQQVVDLLLEGKSNKQIAQVLGITERTVEYHLKNVYEILHVSSAKEAILQLRKSAVTDRNEKLGKSTVELIDKTTENEHITLSRRFPMKSLLILATVLVVTSAVFLGLSRSNTTTDSPQAMNLTVLVQEYPSLSQPHARHTVTRLLNGKILVVGGYQGSNHSLDKVDLFDWTASTLTPLHPLHTARHDHSATLLKDGRVLVVGGYSQQSQWISDAEIYDPSKDMWTVLSPLYPHGTSHTATLLHDGRVLVVGGCIGSGICTERTEIFDPKSDSWAEATPLPGDRASHTANLLNDGRVLVAGGSSASGLTLGGDALIYDPKTNQWQATAQMVTRHFLAQSIRLPGGLILVAGGAIHDGTLIPKMTADAEVYDPKSNAWKAVAPLAHARYGFALVPFRGNLILAIGGANTWDNNWDDPVFVREVEAYDPIADRWDTIAQLPQPGAFVAAVNLRQDQGIWLTGGQSGVSGASVLQTTWLITPSQTQP